MGIRVDWYAQDESVILWTTDVEWTWDEYHAATYRVRDMFAEKPSQRLDVVMDFRLSRMYLRGLRENLAKAQAMEDENPTQQYLLVAVGNHLVRATLEFSRTINPRIGARYRTARTVEEAFQLILRERAELKTPT